MQQVMIGHRGAKGMEPENTLRAFQVGLEHGVGLVECDVHCSCDGEIMVIHDNTLERTTNGQGWIREHSAHELRQLDAGKGERIPFLEEVVDLVRRYNRRLIIEVKGETEGMAIQTAETVAAFLKKKACQEDVVLHSFWHAAVRRVKEFQSMVQTAVIMAVGLPPEQLLQMALDVKADGASIAYDYISPQLVHLTHAHGLRIDAWVLNDPWSFQRMRKMGVDGLITDYPGRFQIQ